MTPLVCAISSPEGSGCGLMFTLRGVLVVLMPFHVLGSLDNAAKTKVVAPVATASSTQSSSDEAAALEGEPAVSSGVPVTTLVTFRLHPKSIFMHSPCPPPGRPPDASHLDYALVACRPVLRHKAATHDCRTQRLEDVVPAATAAAKAAADVAAMGAPATRVVLCAAPKQWLQLSEVPEDDDAKLAVGDVDRRRGRVTVPPVAPKWSVVRYDVNTECGVSGAAVMMSTATKTTKAAAAAAVTRCGAGAGADSEAWSWHGAFVLVAMHRAGADGSDGEGITIYDIFRDVAETMRMNDIRRGLQVDPVDLTPVVAHLAGVFRGSSGGAELHDDVGARCRAATAAARAVSEQPEEAAAAMVRYTCHHPAAREVHVSRGGITTELEDALCRWLSAHPRSIRLAAATCHALGTLARRRLARQPREKEKEKEKDSLGEVDECLLAVLRRHAGVAAVQAHGLWALRQRLKLRLRPGREGLGQAHGQVQAQGLGQGGDVRVPGDATGGGSVELERVVRSGVMRIAAAAEAALAAHPPAGGSPGGGGGRERGPGSSSMRRDATLLVDLCRSALLSNAQETFPAPHSRETVRL